MNSAAIDVIGIGNAIVDVIAHAEERFLADKGFAKGAMTLVDAERAESLYRQMGPAIESSGGSAGNTMAGIASLGGAGGYIGKVRDDLLGEVFRHDITAIGVRFDTPAATTGPGTARCLIMVTPDGQRTMATYLGACVELGREDIDAEMIGAAQVLYGRQILSLDSAKPVEGADYCIWLAGAAGSANPLLGKGDDAVEYSITVHDRNDQSSTLIGFDLKTPAGMHLGTLQCYFPRATSATSVDFGRWKSIVGDNLLLEVKP